jgi:hypothetical protein
LRTSGRVTDYRTAKGNKVFIRRVVVGKNGTITFLITLYLGVEPGHWTITSATKSYTGLHGNGAQRVDNYASTPATFTLAGTVSHCARQTSAQSPIRQWGRGCRFSIEAATRPALLLQA